MSTPKSKSILYLEILMGLDVHLKAQTRSIFLDRVVVVGVYILKAQNAGVPNDIPDDIPVVRLL